jgi:flotillin
MAQEKVAIQQAALTDRTLDTEVRKPADAARYRAEQEAEAERISATKRAEAQKFSTIAQAEAKAEQDRLTGEGEKLRRTALAEAEAIEGERRGAAERAQREAVAKAVQAEGDAQAAATLAVGTSEAEAMQKKADAYAKYNQAAVLEMVVAALPQIAKEIASPMAAIDNLTVLSTEGAGHLTRQVTSTFAQVQEMLKATTGVDLAAMLPQASAPEPDEPRDASPAKA